ncbi:hypothetical protein OO013_02550 [Mangrovivirga sp. M17]|uniref:Uncharacterized protein n=1 Tax=Mangrovivirga halotolerans TaxID=2993936 RepID=A0ABT3RMD0_9BACT|nr:hypothetical protein [Mangrovivirga halotolerans]MCX2742726.1 hypothetical protein [Mangrovivirga halotolerans]
MEDLKNLWENAGRSPYEKKTIKAMTTLRSHPQLNRLKIKFIIEIVAISLFVALYYDAFDGHQKPLILNILLIFFALAYIFSDLAGMYNLYNPVHKGSLVQSLLIFANKIKFYGILNTVSSFLFGLSVITFFVQGVELNTIKILFITGFLIFLIIMTFIAWKLWMKRIRSIERVITKLTTD